jgi:hypothetical protein
MSIQLNDPYYKGVKMIDIANAILDDRRRQACRHRIAANLPRERTLSLGRYEIKVTRSDRVARTA